MAERNPELRDAALLARRATMRIDNDLIHQLAGLAWPDAVASLLDAPIDTEDAPVSSDSEDTINWWARKINRPGSGVHERMTFFWHTLLTTHRYASGDQEMLGHQLRFLRANSLGNFRSLLHGFVTNAALIHYLNANTSTASEPNENLARELMELFTVGIGHYSEADVRNAALAMTGWRTDGDTYQAYFDPERAHIGPTTFLGETNDWDIVSIVDRLCDHPATAARVSSRLWYHLAGTELGPEQANELGAWWFNQNLEIRPLVAHILNAPELRAEYYARPRSGYEFFAALNSIADFDLGDNWRPRMLGQTLYEPPNVAGWPTGDRWLTPDSMLRRSSLIFGFDVDDIEGADEAGPDQILDRLGLYVVGQGTLDALHNAGAGGSFDDSSIAELRWRIAVGSPEFMLT